MKRVGRQYGRPLHDVDSESFEAECLRETGYPPGHYPHMWGRPQQAPNRARGGLPAGARLARAAVQVFGACVVSIEPLARGLHPLVDWEVFALMWANYDGAPWEYTGQFPFVGSR